MIRDLSLFTIGFGTGIILIGIFAAYQRAMPVTRYVITLVGVMVGAITALIALL